MRGWRAANAGKVNEQRRRRYAESPESQRARANRWYHANAPAVSERAARRYEANPDPARERANRWRRANPQARREYAQKREALEKGATKGERIYRSVIFERDSGECHLCGRKVDPKRWHLDHLVPLSIGGDHVYANVAVSHPRCNISKGNRAMNEQLRIA